MIGLDQILLDERSSTRGYIFDGFPSNIEQFTAMQRRSILPFRIIELDIEDSECHARNAHEIKEKFDFYREIEMARIYPKNMSDEEEDEPEDLDEEEEKTVTISQTPAEDLVSITDSEEIMNTFIATFRKEIVEVRGAYNSVYRNWDKMNGNSGMIRFPLCQNRCQSYNST